jgi:acyl dehydratase
VYGVVPTWEALLAVLGEVIPPELTPMLLHAEQDMHFHQPLVPGMVLTTEAEQYSLRTMRAGTWVTARVMAEDAAGAPVLELYSTMFVRGMKAEDAGGDRPEHGFPAAAREGLVAEVVRHVDADQTYRYRDASGDTNPIHVDDEAARAAKLPGIILHGLCTMAMCGAAVVDRVADGDPARLARLAVRFSRPVFPGNDLTVAIYDGGVSEEAGDGRRVYPFEASSAGKLVVRDGRAEVR